MDISFEVFYELLYCIEMIAFRSRERRNVLLQTCAANRRRMSAAENFDSDPTIADWLVPVERVKLPRVDFAYLRGTVSRIRLQRGAVGAFRVDHHGLANVLIYKKIVYR